MIDTQDVMCIGGSLKPGNRPHAWLARRNELHN